MLEDLKRQNKNLTDVAKFAKLEGIPKWDKSMLNIINNATGRSTNTGIDSTLLLPLVIDSVNKVNGFIACTLLNDSILYKLYRGSEYNQNGYATSSLPNANDIISTLLQMEVAVFGAKTKFKVQDSLLRFYHKNTNGIKYYSKIKNTTISNNSIMGLTIYENTNCIDVETAAEPPFDNHPPFVENQCVTTYSINPGGGGSVNNSGSFYGTGGLGGPSTGGGVLIGSGSTGVGPTWIGTGNGGSPAYSTLADWACYWLGMETHVSIFLSYRPHLANQIYFYLNNSTNWDEDLLVAQQHVQKMYDDPAYLAFVENHALNNDGGYVWWKDDLFLIDPLGFNLLNKPWISPPSSTTPPITSLADLTQYLKCFTNEVGSNHYVTIICDQPKYNSTSTHEVGFSGVDVGHTYFELKQVKADGSTVVRNLGFYPSSSVNPLNPIISGVIYKEDTEHKSDIKLNNILQWSTMQNLITSIKTNYNQTYNLNSNNCTTWALDRLKDIDIHLPRTNGTWPGGSGLNPGNLGQDLRALSLAVYQTKNGDKKVSATPDSGTCP